VDRAIEERLRPVPDESMRENVRDNIHQLQTVHSSELFDYAYKQFVTKWSKKKIPEIDTFLEYFRKEWVDSKNNKWYEGAATRVPSTDNGLEGTNAVIKHVYTLRERLSVASYMANAVNMLRNWSIVYRMNIDEVEEGEVKSDEENKSNNNNRLLGIDNSDRLEDEEAPKTTSKTNRRSKNNKKREGKKRHYNRRRE
jgi:hypothetical protein